MATHRDNNITVELLPSREPPLFREAVTVRCHSVLEFLRRWRGSITESTWPKVLAYTVYLAAVSVVFLLGCPDKDAILDGDASDARCFLVTVKLNIEGMFALWMAFTAYLFTSFVNAALTQYRGTLNLVRGVQGRINELSLLLHTYAHPRHGDGTRNAPLADALRWAAALPPLLYARPALAGSEARADAFLAQAAAGLTPEQAERLVGLPDAGHRPFAVMLWISRLVLEHSGEGDGRGGAAFRDDVVFRGAVVGCMERLRGTYGTLLDSLDDAILPFPFAQLTVANVYLIFLLLPYAMIHELGYVLIPAGAIYFWFLDGMITFVFFVHRPFSDHAAIQRNRVPHPLINIYTAIDESLKSLPLRFPVALAQEPKHHSD